VRSAVTAGDPEKSGTALKKAESVLRRAASKGAIPKKRVSRLISRITKSRNQTIAS
jgi:ribosomal protein S20